MTQATIREAANEDDEEDDDEQGPHEDVNFAELLGPECVIKRVDKDQKVIGHAKPEDMQRELMTRASAQKRIGACAEHVKDMSRREKLEWALELKDRANEFYSVSKFEEAAKLYNDCLVAIDLEGCEEDVQEVKRKLQLPVCTNLAACMIEMGQYLPCVEVCDIALSVEPTSCKALYRRGLARYRLGDHCTARPDFEAALEAVRAQRAEATASSGDAAQADAEEKSLADLERRVVIYLSHIRRFSAQERTACKRMFEATAGEGGGEGLYADRPGARAEVPEEAGPIDDSDEAIEAALRRARGSWSCCPCRRGAQKEKQQ